MEYGTAALEHRVDLMSKRVHYLLCQCPIADAFVKQRPPVIAQQHQVPWFLVQEHLDGFGRASAKNRSFPLLGGNLIYT